MPVVIENREALDAYRLEMTLRRLALFLHQTGVETALEAEKKAAPKLTGELRRSIRSEVIVPAEVGGTRREAIAGLGRSELTTAIVTTKPQAHFSWVKTQPIIYPRRSPVLVFPIRPGWKPKRRKELSEKEQREGIVITAFVRGRKYNPWREKGMSDAGKRLTAALGRLNLKTVFEF
jgi:hypothetical protein